MHSKLSTLKSVCVSSHPTRTRTRHKLSTRTPTYPNYAGHTSSSTLFHQRHAEHNSALHAWTQHLQRHHARTPHQHPNIMLMTFSHRAGCHRAAAWGAKEMERKRSVRTKCTFSPRPSLIRGHVIVENAPKPRIGRR